MKRLPTSSVKQKKLTFETGKEHALVRLADNERALVSGGIGGIEFFKSEVERIFGHSHPYHLPPSGPSHADYKALEALGQKSSYILEHGKLIKFRRS